MDKKLFNRNNSTLREFEPVSLDYLLNKINISKIPSSFDIIPKNVGCHIFSIFRSVGNLYLSRLMDGFYEPKEGLRIFNVAIFRAILVMSFSIKASIFLKFRF